MTAITLHRYDPRTFTALTFHDVTPRFRAGSDTPRAYLERCLETTRFLRRCRPGSCAGCRPGTAWPSQAEIS